MMEQEHKYIGVEISKSRNMLKRNCKKSDVDRREDDVTGKNGWIIGFLAENQDREIFQKDIEQYFSIRRSTVSGIIQLMEKKGCIIRESVDYDARLKKLVLTDRAKELHANRMKDLEDNELKLKHNISQEELATFFSVLEKIRSNIETESEKV